MGGYKIVTYQEEKSLKKLIKQMFFWEILQGMSLTFKYMFTKPITMRYPEHKWFMPKRFRGQIALVRDAEKPDEDLCVGCCLCERVCPSGALDIATSKGENERKIVEDYFLNIPRCIFCGLCVEICPVGALVYTDNYELAQYDRQVLRVNKESLLKTGHTWRERIRIMEEKGLVHQTVIKFKPAKWTSEKADITEEELESALEAAGITKEK